MKQYGKICSTAMSLPEKIMTNNDLTKIFETSDEWIFSRTGIKQRRIAVTETTSSLCTEVARQLLQNEGITPLEIDFIIVATMSPDYNTPSVACQVQGNIQAFKAFAFDISAACSGFVYALSLAEKLISSGSYQKGIVIGGETLSKVLDWQDRSSAVLFGDGAAGVFIGADSTPSFLLENLQADGSRANALTSGYQRNNSPFFTEENKKSGHLKMDGRAIFDFAIRDVAANIAATLKMSDFHAAEIDYFLLHQANQRLIEKIAKKTKISREKFLTNMNKYGNTSAASIPILLHENVANGTLKIGMQQKVMLTGYGGGLTWGSILIKL